MDGVAENKPRLYVCYHVQYGRSSLKTVVIEENPKNWGALGLPFDMEPWLTPKKKPSLHMCNHFKFGSFST